MQLPLTRESSSIVHDSASLLNAHIANNIAHTARSDAAAVIRRGCTKTRMTRRSRVHDAGSKAAASHGDDLAGDDSAYHTRGKYEHLPEWRRGNPHIRGWYRVGVQRGSDLIWSMFHLHNETLNIWTHLFGLAMMAALTYTALTTWLRDADWIDIALFLAYSFGQSCQMLFSVVFHTTACWTHDLHKWGARLDYVGIALTIGGSFVQCLYYAFFCRPVFAWLYNSLVFGLCAIATYVIWNPRFHTSQWQWLRAAIFIVTAVFGAIVPMTHALFVSAPGWAFLRPMAINLLEMGFFYLGGAAIYVMRVPEKYFPNALGHAFSLLSSHVIWHVMIIFAAWAHYNVEEENYHLFRPDGRLMTCDEFFAATSHPSPLFSEKKFLGLI